MDEDNQEILKTFPVWEKSVWEALQNKDYETAEENLKSVLGNFDLDDWPLIYWNGILSGIPSVLGDLDEDEWKSMAKPAIIRSVIAAANGKMLSTMIQDLEPDEQLSFPDLFIKNLPGATSDEKSEWLKNKRPSLYVFATSAPGQELGINPHRYAGTLPPSVINKRYKILPQKLKDSLFSYDYADIIFRLGKNNHLSEEKISLLARFTGRTILGFIHPEDFKKELESSLLIDNRIVSVLANEIENKIISPLSSEIKDVYEPVEIRPDAGESVEREIPIGEFSSEGGKIPITSIKEIEEPTPDKPFILHEEKATAPASGEKKSIFKGFSIPLGFFKPKNKGGAQPTAPLRVEVETPDGGKDEKRVVNYSELRTSLSPFENGQGFVNLSRGRPAEDAATTASNGVGATASPKNNELKPVADTPKTEVPAANKTERNEINPFEFKMPEKKNEEKMESAGPKIQIMGTIKKPEPKVEGNVIDLKN